MANLKPLTDDDGEVREWTEEDFARAKSFSQLPESLQRKLRSLKSAPETEKKPARKQISVSLSSDVVDQLQSSANWELHLEEAIRSWLARQARRRNAAS
jgi:uncharacterized protein (DUF4415 family)